MSPVRLISQVKTRSPLCRFGYLLKLLTGGYCIGQNQDFEHRPDLDFSGEAFRIRGLLPEIPIAIVPTDGGWKAVTAPRDRTGRPDCVRRIEQIQKQLREIYVLAKD